MCRVQFFFAIRQAYFIRLTDVIWKNVCSTLALCPQDLFSHVRIMVFMLGFVLLNCICIPTDVTAGALP